MNFYGQFPQTRLRRLRTQDWLRTLVQETALHPSDLILPLFIRTKEAPALIPTMPDVQRWTLEELPRIVTQAAELGILAISLFPFIPKELKTPQGEEALNPDNIVCKAIQVIKNTVPHMGIITDVALDPYTSHGHDGIWNGHTVDNDSSLAILAQQALIQAQAGADILAPSDMMDGRVGAIRQMLDTHHLQDKAIMSYAVKYASAFYGPFREAVSAEKLPSCNGEIGHKKTYQMNPANKKEALREVAQDLQEGADMIMVKPGLPYLDIISSVCETFAVPTFAFQVSGEYSLIKAAALQGWVHEQNALLESLTSMKRAGAMGIFTYAAIDMANFLKS